MKWFALFFAEKYLVSFLVSFSDKTRQYNVLRVSSQIAPVQCHKSLQLKTDISSAVLFPLTTLAPVSGLMRRKRPKEKVLNIFSNTKAAPKPIPQKQWKTIIATFPRNSDVFNIYRLMRII